MIKYPPSWHKRIISNATTCWIDYDDHFIVHAKNPYMALRDAVWLYPCVFNDKRLEIIQADVSRIGKNNYGICGQHFI